MFAPVHLISNFILGIPECHDMRVLIMDVLVNNILNTLISSDDLCVLIQFFNKLFIFFIVACSEAPIEHSTALRLGHVTHVVEPDLHPAVIFLLIKFHHLLIILFKNPESSFKFF